MKIYSSKNLKTSFVIICSDNSLSLLKSTANSIKSKYYDHPFICVANGSATVEEVAAMKAICPTYKGKKTISSMINVGLRHAPADWAFIVFSGSFLPGKMDEKFSFFINSEKDILFPIINRKTNFIDGTWNGLLINKKTFREVGEFEDDGEFEHIKCEWACNALNYGCKFKAILGSKVC